MHTKTTMAGTAISLEDALQMTRTRNIEYHTRHLNPRLAKLLRIMDADLPIVRASGSYFWDADGRRFLDFLTGFGALALGNNHPRMQEALRLVAEVPVLIQGLNHLAGALAHNLTILAPEGLARAFFANSGAEAVDASIKLARAATGKSKLVACHKCFHGRTLGALSLFDNLDFRSAFEPLLPGVMHVKYGDPESLEAALRNRDVAAFIVEPVQGEGGIHVPPSGYLREVRRLCSRYGALMIADEVQTGLGRTGIMFAVNHEDVSPDVLLLGKGLGGGLMPLSAVLTTEAVFRAAKCATPRSPFQTPTFGANARSCAAGIAALEVLTIEHLPARAADMGAYLLERLRELQQRHPVIAEVRGRGLMLGIEFAPPTAGWSATLTGGVVNRLFRGVFTQLVILELYREHHVMTAFTLNDLNVLRLEPPLNVERADADYVIDALDQTLGRLQGYFQGTLRSWRYLLSRENHRTSGCC
jgi:putrescine aminotransferase